MSREIKFRAWNGQELLSPKRTEVEISLRGFTQSDDFILNQFTGLRDRNGKEIYGGDILKSFDGYLWTIIWHDGGWHIESEISMTPLRESVIEKYGLEVIANIYEMEG